MHRSESQEYVERVRADAVDAMAAIRRLMGYDLSALFSTELRERVSNGQRAVEEVAVLSRELLEARSHGEG